MCGAVCTGVCAEVCVLVYVWYVYRCMCGGVCINMFAPRCVQPTYVLLYGITHVPYVSRILLLMVVHRVCVRSLVTLLQHGILPNCPSLLKDTQSCLCFELVHSVLTVPHLSQPKHTSDPSDDQPSVQSRHPSTPVQLHTTHQRIGVSLNTPC